MEQAIDELGFCAQKVILARYPQDIDVNLTHLLRKTTDSPILIFPNRLDESYNPLFALEVFSEFLKKYPNSILKMNEMGELKNECLTFIDRNNLSNNVVFLEGISSWDDLPKIYAEAHVALFTATDSNGPNSLIECMASGTGVVLSNLIFNTDKYCKHEINCFKHDLHVNDFVSALIKYVEEEGLIEQHGSISKNLVRERSVSNTAKFYAEIIREHTKHHINID
ncbi:group 1 glycosyl transferase [Nitritalea halalkaliphila LW7]|uniref:Group 1 glycosyl transferase n=1 Tax=Nitritalea halalkaliphila LW7 TaxID=1189621 RepID=I5C5Y6_9BACT|nr:glycosyltransferase [Nitritalea halalkaliphila]EIM77238.1 group 1 glycosyl transferase [Nitritalea halalkaliphila LW7]